MDNYPPEFRYVYVQLVDMAIWPIGIYCEHMKYKAQGHQIEGAMEWWNNIKGTYKEEYFTSDHYWIQDLKKDPELAKTLIEETEYWQWPNPEEHLCEECKKSKDGKDI